MVLNCYHTVFIISEKSPFSLLPGNHIHKIDQKNKCDGESVGKKDFTIAKRVRFENKLNNLRHPRVTQTNIGRFYTRRRIIRLKELGKHLLFVWLCVFSIKTGSTSIIRLDELQMQSKKSPEVKL